jgi:hypothetical protein
MMRKRAKNITASVAIIPMVGMNAFGTQDESTLCIAENYSNFLKQIHFHSTIPICLQRQIKIRRRLKVEGKG